MTQEDRQLLLKDLCARLPYGVKFKADNEECIREIHYIRDEDVYIREYSNLPYWIDTIKPYFRPMSSMTKEERNEYRKAFEKDFAILEDSIDAPIAYKYSDGMIVSDRVLFNEIDWLNKKMFDFRGLIPMGLALEAKEDMYKTE